MSKFAICDNCGHKDDWSTGGTPFLYGGVVIQFREEETGSEEIEREVELCEECRALLFERFPALVEREEKQDDQQPPKRRKKK